MALVDEVEPGSTASVGDMAKSGGSLSATPFINAVQDFYLTNPIARASAVMAEMSTLKREMSAGGTGTHG